MAQKAKKAPKKASRTVKKAVARVKAAVKKPAKKPAAKAKKSPARAGPAAAKKPVAKKKDPGPRPTSVDDYITHVPAPFKAVLAELRQVVMTAEPETTCSIKWGQPVFECHGPFAWMKAFSSHADLGFFRGAELADPDGILVGTGAKMRHVKITVPEHIPVAKLDALVRAAVALNRAGA
jgi:hypothetical protein